MGQVKGFFFFLSTLIFLLCSISSYAREIKYSLGPICGEDEEEIICSNQYEVPTCVKLYPKVQWELITDANGNLVNNFKPSCQHQSQELLPSCVDINNGEKDPTGDRIVECIEFINCVLDEKENKLIPTCSSGKTPICLGSDSKPNCKLKTICEDGSIPACDYVWEAYLKK